MLAWIFAVSSVSQAASGWNPPELWERRERRYGFASGAWWRPAFTMHDSFVSAKNPKEISQVISGAGDKIGQRLGEGEQSWDLSTVRKQMP